MEQVELFYAFVGWDGFDRALLFDKLFEMLSDVGVAPQFDGRIDAHLADDVDCLLLIICILHVLTCHQFGRYLGQRVWLVNQLIIVNVFNEGCRRDGAPSRELVEFFLSGSSDEHDAFYRKFATIVESNFLELFLIV